MVYVGFNMHYIVFSFISGVRIGIEFLTGKQTQPNDKFVILLDLGIIRITYVYR